jgi:hypothetical protein
MTAAAEPIGVQALAQHAALVSQKTGAMISGHGLTGDLNLKIDLLLKKISLEKDD